MSVTEADTSLTHLQPKFRARVLLFLNDCQYEKLPVIVVETLRSYARSSWLYAKGRTSPGPKVTNAKGGFSYHGFGLAIDLVLKDTHGNPTWDFDPKGPVWRRVVQLAKMRGLAWGGDWLTFKDVPHFQENPSPWLWICRRKWPGGWKG